MKETPVNLAFQEFLSKHLDEKVIDFEPLLASHPELKDQLQKKIDAYRFIHGAIGSGADKPSKDVMVGKSLGGCVIKKLIREGGMSFVYLAHQTGLGRDVALKILKSALANSEASISRFQRECRNISRLDHEHILPVYDVGFEDGLHYVITKHVDGISVEDVIRLLQKRSSHDRLIDEVALLAKGLPATWRQKFGSYRDFVLSVMAKVARALAFTHSRGVIHRDVKPSNILITKDGEPMLIDFGLSRDIAQTSLTLSGEYLGTPVYSSPEQLVGLGDHVDERSDVYSLGITACEFLTGCLPFSGENMLEILANSKLNAPNISSEVDTDTREVLLRAISKDKEGRYGSVVEFAEDFARIQNQDVAPDRAVSGGDAFKSGKRVSKTTERKRWPKKIIAVGIAGSVAAFVVTLGLFQLQRHQPQIQTGENTEIGGIEKKMERADTNARSDNSVYALSIRNVDFNNYTYPGTENLQDSQFSTDDFTIKNGELEYAKGSWNLDKITYGDVTGDGQEEAIVRIIFGPSGGNYVLIYVYVFTLSNNTPKFLWGIESTDILTANAQEGMLVFEVAEYEANDPICCPSKFSKRKFKWFTGTFMMATDLSVPSQPNLSSGNETVEIATPKVAPPRAQPTGYSDSSNVNQPQASSGLELTCNGTKKEAFQYLVQKWMFGEDVEKLTYKYLVKEDFMHNNRDERSLSIDLDGDHYLIDSKLVNGNYLVNIVAGFCPMYDQISSLLGPPDKKEIDESAARSTWYCGNLKYSLDDFNQQTMIKLYNATKKVFPSRATYNPAAHCSSLLSVFGDSVLAGDKP